MLQRGRSCQTSVGTQDGPVPPPLFDAIEAVTDTAVRSNSLAHPCERGWAGPPPLLQETVRQHPTYQMSDSGLWAVTTYCSSFLS